jgi:tetratricopeptide (TPR) repeat protein/predicted Ser/Thr protein kinase
MTPYSPERDERVMTLLELALNTPVVEREACLHAACSGDEPLFEEILERARWEEEMGAFLLEPLVPRVELDHPFTPGQLVSERFEIVREVAEGGMAVVYEAIDRKLDERIAVKCPKVIFRRRLPPEARSALKVSHPNICRVHGIHTTATDRGEVDFLTMEFLDGETLLERLRREKRFSVAQASEIASQICAGLEEAHRQGIIHGDLKSSNIILAKTAQGQLRAVITDFGLARQAHRTGAQGLARSSHLRGAPDFIAPELWKGARNSEASDIYALGVMLYEMIAGERPWSGKPPEARFESAPEPPGKLAPDVPANWSRAVLRCLAPEPAARPRSPRELMEQLEGKRSRVRVWLAAAAVFILCVVAVWFRMRPPPATRIALLPFEADAESNALATGIVYDLSSRLVHLQRRDRGVLVIPLSEALQNQVRTPQMARAALGATHTFQVRFRTANGKLVANATVRNAETEQTVRDFAGEYTLAELGALPKALLGAITAALKLKGATPSETVLPAAYPDYAQGVYYLRGDTYTVERAVPFFERAAQLDLHSALPHAGIAEAEIVKFRTSEDRQWLLGAQDASKKAEARNPDAVEVRIVAGLVNQAAGWHEKALEDFRRAVQLEPGNPEALRRLAGAYRAMNLTDEAVRTYHQAIAAQPGYYRPYLDLGIFYYYRAQYDDALAQFQRVTKLAPALAQGHFSLGAVFTDMGRYQQGEAALLEALRLRKDRDTLLGLGALLAYEKRHAESAGYYERARKIGPDTYLLLSNLADSYRRTERSADALEAYREALELADAQVIENPRNSEARAFAAYLSARLRDHARAQREIRQAMRLAPEDTKILRRAVLTYEVLQLREDALKVLENAPATLIKELSRQPDLADLQRDSRFLSLLSRSQ